MMYAACYTVVYLDTEMNEYVMVHTAKDSQQYLHTLLCHKGKKQKLKNIFHVNYKGEVTKFKDLQLNEKVQLKIKELTTNV